MFDQLHPDKVTNTGCNKCKYHLHGATTQQKCKSTTCKCRCQSEFYRRIECMNLFNFIQPLVDFFACQMCFPGWKTIYKLFHPIKFGSIYSGICNTKRLGNTLFSVKTVKLYRHQSHIHRTGYSQFLGKPVHRSPHTPCSGSAGKHDQTNSADNGCLFNQSCLLNQHFTVISCIIMPWNFHMIFFHNFYIIIFRHK